MVEAMVSGTVEHSLLELMEEEEKEIVGMNISTFNLSNLKIRSINYK